MGAFELGTVHIIYGVLFMMFVILGSVTVMNMLTGMLVQVVSGIADMEKEEMNLAWVKGQMERVIQSMDVNRDEQLSKEEVAQLLCEPEACRVIEKVGVDVSQLVEVAEFHIFKDRKTISFREFLDLVLQLRKAKIVCLK